MNQYALAPATQTLPPASLPDTTAPTFGGATGATPNLDASFTLAWLAATDASNPIRYRCYLALGSVSAAALFVPGNLVKTVEAPALSTRLFSLGDQLGYLIRGQIYTLGVRAVDAYGNMETNTVVVTATATASGNLPDIYQTVAAALQVTAGQTEATQVLLEASATRIEDAASLIEAASLDQSLTVELVGEVLGEETIVGEILE